MLILNGKSRFFQKNMLKKLNLKIERNFVLKKKLKRCSESRTTERASLASQPSKPSHSRKPSKASKPTTNGKILFFKKNMVKIKKNKKKCHFEKKAEKLLIIENKRVSEPFKSTKQIKFAKQYKASK